MNIVLPASIAAVVFLMPSCRNRSHGDVPAGPDELAWRLLAQVNSKEPVVWDDWEWTHNLILEADAPMLTRWIRAGHKPDMQNMLIALETVKERGRLISILHELSGAGPGAGPLMAFYNGPLAKAITTNNLNTRRGLGDAFRKGLPLDFGRDTIAVKAKYKFLKPGDADRYHINPKEKDYGVTGFHIAARIFPQWIWATWEQETIVKDDQANHGLCCSDSFGWDKDRQRPSAELIALFNSKKVPDVWWKHYRLVGAQIYSVDATGGPTRLGNYAIEKGLPDVSCITCHSRAAFNESAASLDLTNDIGAPVPSWFKNGTQVSYLQYDFLWAILTELKSERLLTLYNIDLFNLQ